MALTADFFQSFFGSLTSAQASNLMGHNNTAAGSLSRSYGHDSSLQLCDSCLAAYPVQDFPNYICTANYDLEKIVGFI